MPKLTYRGRKRMKQKQFALPGRRYPINDLSHARNALARVSAFGSNREKRIVRRKVYSRYPSLRR